MIIPKVLGTLGNALKMHMYLSSGMKTTYPGQHQVWTESSQFSWVWESWNSLWSSSCGPGMCPLVRTIYFQARTWERASERILVPQWWLIPGRAKSIGSSTCFSPHSSFCFGKENDTVINIYIWNQNILTTIAAAKWFMKLVKLSRERQKTNTLLLRRKISLTLI